MNISVDLRNSYGSFPLESFREIASELEILATKKIPHDELKKALFNDFTVRKREITVDGFNSPNFWYYVEDFIHDERGKLLSIGYAQYNSKEIRKRTPSGSVAG